MGHKKSNIPKIEYAARGERILILGTERFLEFGIQIIFFGNLGFCNRKSFKFYCSRIEFLDDLESKRYRISDGERQPNPFRLIVFFFTAFRDCRKDKWKIEVFLGAGQNFVEFRKH